LPSMGSIHKACLMPASSMPADNPAGMEEAGIKQALWMEPIDGNGLMISLWQDEATARAAAPPVGFSPAPDVTVESVDVRAVIAQA